MSLNRIMRNAMCCAIGWGLAVLAVQTTGCGSDKLLNLTTGKLLQTWKPLAPSHAALKPN
jgi:hypothetical protein